MGSDVSPTRDPDDGSAGQAQRIWHLFEAGELDANQATHELLRLYVARMRRVPG